MSRVTCSRIPDASAKALASSKPSRCLSKAIIPSGDCLMKSKMVSTSPMEHGKEPFSMSTRFAD